MVTIGIRASPSQITFAIYDSLAATLLNVENIKVPLSLERSEALKYIRNNVLDVLREYDVQAGGLREAESVAMKTSLERVQFEAVIQEAFASSCLEKYFIGQISSIASRARIAKTAFKEHTENDLDYPPISDWLGYSKEEREAIFAALGAVNA